MASSTVQDQKPGLLRIVVTTRWSADGDLLANSPTSSPVVKVWEKSRRRGESARACLARVEKDVSWYVDTPSQYYAGSTVEIQRRDECGVWVPLPTGSEVDDVSL